MTLKNIISGLLFFFIILFFTFNVAMAQEEGSNFAGLTDQVVMAPATDSDSSELGLSSDANESLVTELPGLGGKTFLDPSAGPAEPEDEVSDSNNAQTLSDGGKVIEYEEDRLDRDFEETALGGDTFAEPHFSPDVDNEEGLEVATDTNQNGN